MKSEGEISGPELVRGLLKMIWVPALAALRVQTDLNVGSLEETSAAVQQAGYEVCYADLPVAVSGFATIIAGKPHIVVSRANPPQQQQYTVPHELGHHILGHANPSGNRGHSLLPIDGDLAEFQTDMFAATWVRRVTKGRERQEVLRQNPESDILFLAMFMTVGILVVALLADISSRLSRERLLHHSGEK